MKVILILCIAALLLSGCSQEKKQDCYCTQQFDPVCGEDKITYSNSCFADCFNIKYTPGECKE